MHLADIPEGFTPHINQSQHFLNVNDVSPPHQKKGLFLWGSVFFFNSFMSFFTWDHKILHGHCMKIGAKI